MVSVAFRSVPLNFWNDLPEHVKFSLNLTSFKGNLKIYLFKRYFHLLFCSSIFLIYFLSYCFRHYTVKHLRALE